MGSWINGRGDANAAGGKPGTRYKDRLEAFGKAVPPDTKISRGLDGPPEESAFPEPRASVSVQAQGGQVQAQVQQVQQVQQQQGLAGVQQMQGVGDGDIAEFMDLDRMEEGFSQGYGEQGGQF